MDRSKEERESIASHSITYGIWCSAYIGAHRRDERNGIPAHGGSIGSASGHAGDVGTESFPEQVDGIGRRRAGVRLAELADVIITAAVAMNGIAGNVDEAVTHLERRLAVVTERAGL
jgi:hypothetical protein